MLKRLYDLLVKLVSMKGLFAIICTVGYFMGLVPDWVFLLSWTLVIGAREVAKGVNALKGVPVKKID